MPPTLFFGMLGIVTSRGGHGGRLVVFECQIEDIWSYGCFNCRSILGPCGLHFRGLGQPSVAFWRLWVPRLMSGSHAVALLDDLGSLWAPKWVARAAAGTPKSCRRVP